MCTSALLNDEALRFIQQLDEEVFEAFTRGIITSKDYQIVAQQIAALQQLMLRVLDAIEGVQQNIRRLQDT